MYSLDWQGRLVSLSAAPLRPWAAQESPGRAGGSRSQTQRAQKLGRGKGDRVLTLHAHSSLMPQKLVAAPPLKHTHGSHTLKGHGRDLYSPGQINAYISSHVTENSFNSRRQRKSLHITIPKSFLSFSLLVLDRVVSPPALSLRVPLSLKHLDSFPRHISSNSPLG